MAFFPEIPPQGPGAEYQALSDLTRFGSWQLGLCHQRPRHFFLWITRGQGQVILQGRRRGIGVNAVLFVPAGHIFALDLGPMGQAHALTYPADGATTLPQFPHLLRLSGAAARGDISLIFDQIMRETAVAAPLFQEAVHTHAELAAIWLRRQLFEDANAPEKPSAAQRLAARFLNELSATPPRIEPMSDIAARLGVTPTHLSRCCARQTGRSAAQIIGERVAYSARILLLARASSVQNIASYLGFSSPAYFTRFMRRHTGLPPKDLIQTA